MFTGFAGAPQWTTPNRADIAPRPVYNQLQ
jgi:hypothetical protein